MNPTVTIVEVLGRSSQGMSKPFLCRGGDGALYYAKGRNTDMNALCCEWIAGNLGRDMGLRIPDFAIADVPQSLVAASDRSDIYELGSGLVFVSKRLENAREISWSEAKACHNTLKAEVLSFDLWVHNEDRAFSQLGGNPNLLMDQDGLSVFDFNLAFDPAFTREGYFEKHIFGPLLPAWPVGFQDTTMPKMRAVLGRFDEIFDALPLEWLHIDGDESLPVQIDRKLVHETLSSPFNDPDSFWNRP
ncbi:MAG: HipA family kinase [Chthoniobacteraceae bacterium]